MSEGEVFLAELRDVLADDPTAFEFFQAVRLLEQLSPDRDPVGEFGDPEEEVVRFSVNPAIGFPASEIQSLELLEDAPSPMMINFLGLTGPQGVLPYYYSLLVAERLRARDRALRDLLDIFHHRIVSLLYQAWKRRRFTASYDTDQRDRVTQHLLDLVGLGPAPLQERKAVPDEALLFYAGLLAPQPRTAAGLEQLLEDFFVVPVEVEQFVGGWYPLAVDSQCYLDDGRDRSSQLGMGAVVGDEIWDQQARVRLRIGPLTREVYEKFLPGGDAHEALRTLTRLFSHDQFDFEAQLVLLRDEVPGCVLDSSAAAPAPLGWCTWIRSAPFSHDADETILML
jgi:type VI secretion system protein ImpH